MWGQDLEHKVAKSLTAQQIKYLNLLSKFDPWVVGGTIRDAIMGYESDDLDMVVANEMYKPAVERLKDYSMLIKENRHGNARLVLNCGLKVDLWTPSRFFGGTHDFKHMLEKFDYSCNAVAFSPLHGLCGAPQSYEDISRNLLRPLEHRWSFQSPSEYAHLIGRGIGLVRRRCFVPIESQFFEIALENMDENLLSARYGVSKEQAAQVLSKRPANPT